MANSFHSQIKKKAERLYNDFLISLILKEEFFPKKINFPKINTKSAYTDLKKKVQEVMNIEGNGQKPGPKVLIQKIKTIKYGEQSIPYQIFFDSQDEYLRFIGKTKEAKQFIESYQLIIQQVPELELWAKNKNNVLTVIKYQNIWSDLLLVCRYFLDNTVDGLYLRQIPLEIHTKFIEDNKAIIRPLLDCCLPHEKINEEESNFLKRFGLKKDPQLVRFRILDRKLIKEIGYSFSDISIPLEELSSLDLPTFQFKNISFLVVENKMTFLTIPSLPNVITIFGKGIAAESLDKLRFLKNYPIYYWGDMDVQGIEILSQFRKLFPHTKSLFMNLEVFKKFSDWAVEGHDKIRGSELFLDSEEKELFDYLDKNSLRLEQERLPQIYIDKKLQLIFGKY